MGQAIAFVSGKGGTGKTSLVAGVGAALAQSGKNVLCIDCDISLRNLDLALGLSDRALMDFSDVLLGRCSFENAVIRHPELKKLYFLTAPLRLASGDVTEAQMRRFIGAAKQVFDYVLLDAPAGLGLGFSLSLAGADRAVVVTQNDPSSLRDAQHTVSLLSRFPKGSLHLIVNRVDAKLFKTLHAAIDDAMDAAGLPLIGIVPEDELVPIALARSTSLLLTGDRRAAVAYKNIARRLDGERVPLMKIR